MLAKFSNEEVTKSNAKIAEQFGHDLQAKEDKGEYVSSGQRAAEFKPDLKLSEEQLKAEDKQAAEGFLDSTPKQEYVEFVKRQSEVHSDLINSSEAKIGLERRDPKTKKDKFLASEGKTIDPTWSEN